jgi:hypothetical protein
MSVNIKLKRSSVPGNIPTIAQLELGEIALNTYDGKAYFKKQVGVSQSIVELTSAGSASISASYATYAATAGTSSYAITASYVMNGGGGGLSALYIQDEGTTQGTASYINFVGAGVTATVTSGTASISINGGGSSGTGQSVIFTQATPATTWSFSHNLNNQYVTYNVYDGNNNSIIPANVSASNANTLVITFGVATSGHAVATVGGGLPYISGSYSGYILTVSSSVATWAPTSSLFPNLSSYSIVTGSITASVDTNPNNLFLIKSGSTTYLNISSSGNTTLYSNLFIVKNFTTQQPVLTISQSVVQFATQSFNPSGTTTAGSIWFTSSSMYIGLEN